MAEAYYEPTPATDGATMNPVPGAVFEVYEIADTTFSTPLSLRVGSGNPTTTVTASDTLATLPGVYVTSPNYEHIWKSGTFQWRRDSIDGAKKNIEAAKIAAESAASSAASSAQTANDVVALVDIEVDLVTNGSFRDGFTGWGNTGAWIVETSTATSWARTMSGSDGALTRSITIPSHLLGKTLRLSVLAMTTSTGTLQTQVTTTAGATALQHTLATGAYQLKTLDVAIPAGQGATPVTLAVGRWSGTVFMTAIRLEAL